MDAAVDRILSSLPKEPPVFTVTELRRHVRKSNQMIARLLIALRKHLGLSHEEVAARAGVSPSTVRSQEAAGPRSSVVDLMCICNQGLGFDVVSVLFDGERRDYEEGNILPGKGKPWSEAQFIKMCYEPGDRLTPAEVRRQLRVLKSLTLPSRPGPPARKRAAKKSPSKSRTARGRR